MKTLGSILIAGGIVLMIYALAFMDTSIAVDYQGENIYGMPSRVNNLGLMADRQNYIIAASVSILVGLVLCYLPKSKAETDKGNKKCPQCAEQVKREAKVCRFCNYQFTEDDTNKKLQAEMVVRIIEDYKNNWYFIYKDLTTNTTSKYVYVDKFSAERSLTELTKGGTYSKIGLLRIINS